MKRARYDSIHPLWPERMKPDFGAERIELESVEGPITAFWPPARNGQLWTLVEDRDLLRGFRRLRRKHPRTSPRRLWPIIAAEHQRTVCAVENRYHLLEAALRFVRATAEESS